MEKESSNDVIKSLLEKANDNVATGVIIGDILAGAKCIHSIRKEVSDLDPDYYPEQSKEERKKEERNLRIKIFAKHIAKTAALVVIGRCISSCVNNFVEAAITKLGDNSSSNS